MDWLTNQIGPEWARAVAPFVGIYGVALAGWSSNSKYSLMGGLRASAQMISYELSLGLSLVGIVLISGTLDLYSIVEQQGGWFGLRWNLWDVSRVPQVIGFLTYLLFLYIWLRGTLPRFRFDQLMNFGWKFLLPVAILNVILPAYIMFLRLG